MTVGTSSWDGLGMGLNGEYEMTQQVAATDFLTLTAASSITGDFLVLRESDGTEKLYINNIGTIFIRNDIATTAYMALDARSTINDAATGTWYAGLGIRLTNNSGTTSAGQKYAGYFYFIAGSSSDNTGGNSAVISLRSQCTSGALGVSWSQHAFIGLNDGGTDCASFLHSSDITASSGGILAANVTGASTHGLKCSFGGTAYYILLTTCAS